MNHLLDRGWVSLELSSDLSEARAGQIEVLSRQLLLVRDGASHQTPAAVRCCAIV